MLMDIVSEEELESKIEEYYRVLEQSQCANRNPKQYPDCNRLSAKEHFEMWDKMWKLIKEKDARNKMKSVGS